MKDVRIRVDRAARQELTELILWFEREQPGVGSSLRRAFIKSLDLLSLFPEMYPVERLDVRYFTLARYPVLVFYRYSENVVTILRVRHASRERD